MPIGREIFGRESELTHIRQYLDPDAECCMHKSFVLYGLDGIGKTKLATQFALQYQTSYTSIIWLDGKMEDTLLQSIMAIEHLLPVSFSIQLPKKTKQQAMATEESRKRAQTVLSWFASPRNRRWLIIYDNIDNTSTLAEPSDTKSLESYDIM
jgi:Cdc6-like AAA superfamily ATPase